MKKQYIKRIELAGLSVFEKQLQSLDIEDIFEILEAAPLSSNEFQLLHKNIDRANMKRILKKAKRAISSSGLPFGRFLQLIRMKSKASIQAVASLKKEPSYLIKIELCQINPLQIPPHEMADILELFRITLTELKATIKAQIKVAALRRKPISGMARSSILRSNDKGEALSHAMDAVLHKVQGDQHKGVKIDEKYLMSVETILREKGEHSLLV